MIDVAALIIGGVFLVLFVIIGVMIVRPMDENE
jgi:hypothetical protein